MYDVKLDGDSTTWLAEESEDELYVDTKEPEALDMLTWGVAWSDALEGQVDETCAIWELELGCTVIRVSVLLDFAEASEAPWTNTAVTDEECIALVVIACFDDDTFVTPEAWWLALTIFEVRESLFNPTNGTDESWLVSLDNDKNAGDTANVWLSVITDG